MLRNYLTSVPYTKFIVIQDNIDDRGKPIFDFLLNHHLDKSETNVHYFVFQENINRVKNTLQSKNNIVVHDCITNACHWNESENRETLSEKFNRLTSRDVAFIDSLAHVIYQYGLTEAYKIFNTVKTQSCVMQIICLLHLDLIEQSLKVDELFKHLCTLSIIMQPKFNNNYKRMKYLYKKVGGKVINETEEYYFESNNLQTQKVEKIDVNKLLANGSSEVNPENLATFRISLTEEEKKSRDQLVLPYLPKPIDQSTSEGSNIFYEFDEQDDWDEEDPDDDLDI